jgi:dihydrofolate reductase
MQRLRVHNVSISLDGFAAGPDQGPDAPLGIGGESLHEWVFETRSGRRMFGLDGGVEGIDDDFITAGEAGIGATIMGRNMFGPVRGSWDDRDWKGWWGDEPPYHHPVFVLTHHPREPLPMQGGTTFHFVDAPIDQVLSRALEAAGGLDVRLGGGPAVIRQFLGARLVDHLHIALVPVLLGSGERLLVDVSGYVVSEYRSSERVAHFILQRAD